jgi:membrane protease YdiL (CAAX protease family)
MWLAGVLDGIVFGVVHASSTSFAALPVLAFLGLVFCYVYERTGTLYATIALHALNNTISYGVVTDNGWGAALATGGLVIAGCVLAVARSPRGGAMPSLDAPPPSLDPPPPAASRTPA